MLWPFSALDCQDLLPVSRLGFMPDDVKNPDSKRVNTIFVSKEITVERSVKPGKRKQMLDLANEDPFRGV